MSNFIKDIFAKLKFPRDSGSSVVSAPTPDNIPTKISGQPVFDNQQSISKDDKLKTVANPSKSGLFLSPPVFISILILIVVGTGIGVYMIMNKKLSSSQLPVSSSLPDLISTSPSPTSSPTPASYPTTSASPTTKISPTPSPSITKKMIHLYPAYGANPNTQINKIHIISLFFVPKDIDTSIKNEWQTNMEKVDSKIKSFFEKQFAYNIEVTYKSVSQPIKGNLNISEYTPTTLVQEAKEQTNSLVVGNSHNIWMIYLVRDSEYKKNIIGGNLGGLTSLQAATQFEFWLDNDMINSTGLEGSAHEFAHALGIPHPWELPSNTTHDPNYGNVSGDLMGYSNSGLNLDNLYIRDDVKKEMGL